MYFGAREERIVKDKGSGVEISKPPWYHLMNPGGIGYELSKDLTPQNTFRVALNFLEYTQNFCYNYFNFHGCFSFHFRFLIKPYYEGKAPFFIWVLNSDRKHYTTLSCAPLQHAVLALLALL